METETAFFPSGAAPTPSLLLLFLAGDGRLALSEGGGECNSEVAGGGGGISLLSLSFASQANDLVE